MTRHACALIQHWLEGYSLVEMSKEQRKTIVRLRLNRGNRRQQEEKKQNVTWYWGLCGRLLCRPAICRFSGYNGSIVFFALNSEMQLPYLLSSRSWHIENTVIRPTLTLAIRSLHCQELGSDSLRMPRRRKSKSCGLTTSQYLLMKRGITDLSRRKGSYEAV